MNAPTLDTAVASLARFAGTVPPAQSVTAPFDDSVVVFAASLLVGVVSVWIVKGIASGAYFVLREVSSEGIE